MATYSPLSTAIIALTTGAVETPSFSKLMFMAAHNSFSERVRIYNDADDVAADIGVDSSAHVAAKTALAQSGSQEIYIGRIGVSSIFSFPETINTGDVFSATITVNDNDQVIISHTAGAAPTAQTVAEAFETAILAVTEVTDHINVGVLGSGTTAQLRIQRKDETLDELVVSDVSANIAETFGLVESGAEAFTRITAENDDCYFITSQYHDWVWVESLGDSVNAEDKQYWFTSSSANNLDAIEDPATSILGLANAKNWQRVVGGYHQDADTDFPEVGAIAFKSYTLAGSISWDNMETSGIAASAGSDGKRITSTQKKNLLDKNAFFWDYQGGRTFVNSDVKTFSGHRPEDVRGRDNMEADIVAVTSDYLLAQRDTKIGFNQEGIDSVYGLVIDVCEKYRNERNFIEAGYIVTRPLASTITAGQKASQILDNITIRAQLTGAITMINAVRGSLTLDAVEA